MLVAPRYEYAYDERGNQTLIRDPLGRETRLTYDQQGRQISRTLPLSFGPDGSQGTPDDFNLPEGNFKEEFTSDSRGRHNLHITFEGVVKEMVYEDTLAGGGRIKETRYWPFVRLTRKPIHTNRLS